jgi:hypothetical protein
MRTPASITRWLLVVVLALCATGRARADDPRVEARAHFTAGMKDYRAANYQAAIQEFSAAQQLAPADLNNYNLALCYDKLGQAEPAIQYYQAYLAKVPDAAKRPEIEASIARLQAALQSAAAKRDEEAKAAAAAKAAEDAKAAAAAKAAEDAKAAAAAKAAPAPAPAAPPAPAAAVGAAPAPAPATGSAPAAPAAGVAVGVSSTGTPGTGESVSTGDAQLDRVNAINLDQIRDQRLGTGAGNAAEPPTGPGEEAPPPPAGADGSAKPAAANNNVAVQPTDKPAAPQETPVYKKWWFWAIVAVSGYVVYEIATSSSSANQPVGRDLPLNRPGHYTSNAGITLLHF